MTTLTPVLVPTVLDGGAVRLEPFADAHVPLLLAHADDPDSWRYMGAFDLSDATLRSRWLDLVRAERGRGEGVAFAIVHAPSGEVAGCTSLYDFSGQHRRAEIGRTWLAGPYRRSQVNTHAKLLLLTHCFDTLALNRVQLKTDGRNERSQRAIERLGATREGVLRAHMVLPDGFVRDTVMYSVVRAEWPRVRARLQSLMERV